MADEDLRRNLPRSLFLLAAAGYVVSTFLPWASGVAVGRPVQYAAYQGGEGVWLVIMAAVLAVIGASGMVAGATSRTLQLLPALITVIAAFMWLGANTLAQNEITFWLNELGTGGMTLVRVLCLAAIAANGVGWLLLEIWRPADVRRRTQPITRELGVNRWSLGTVVAAMVLGALGGMIGLYVIITAFGAKVSIVALLVAVVGLFVGAAIGVRLVRWLQSRVSRA